MTDYSTPELATAAEAEAAAARLEQVFFEIKKVIVGQDHMVERLLVALLARGHILLEGLPGLAKTLAVSTMAESIGGSFVRLQFTPDLLPSDLVGTRVYRQSDETFDIEWGPVFANLVLTDEINRAPAKVQSALLEVMAERQVSIGGETRSMPSPFLVLATQNPIESEGVYTLPEAQRDRFLMKVIVGYPTPTEEFEIVRRVGVSMPHSNQVITLDELAGLQRTADQVYVDSAIVQYAVDIVMATREPEVRGMPELASLIEFGVSPRATLGLVSAGRALALMRGRSYVTPQDIFDVARDVLRHRLILTYEALAKNLSSDDVLNRLLAVVPAANVTAREVPAERSRVPEPAAWDGTLGSTPSSFRSPSPAPGPVPTPPPAPAPAPNPVHAPAPEPAPTGGYSSVFDTPSTNDAPPDPGTRAPLPPPMSDPKGLFGE